MRIRLLLVISILMIAFPAHSQRVYFWKNGQKVYFDNPDSVVYVLIDSSHSKKEPAKMDYVNLGLPSGNLWANMNLGANTVEDIGDLYAWGETETKSSFSWSNYKDYSFMDEWIEKNRTDEYGFSIEDIYHPAYVSFPNYGMEISGTNNDVALFLLGGNWHMPSDVDFKELLSCCNWETTKKNGIDGYKVSSKVNGNWIFLPQTDIWTSSKIINGDESKAICFSNSVLCNSDCCNGLSIRPVYNNSVTKIIVDRHVLSATVGYSSKLIPICYPANVKHGACVWRSENDSIVSVDDDGDFVVTGVGSTHIVVSLDQAVGSCYVESYSNEHTGHYYVDLGLSVKWATCNVGARVSNDYGNYYSWGELVPKTSYRESNYLYSDNPSVLPLSKDIANVTWGGNWRMPTKSEQDELQNKDNCSWVLTTIEGISGYKIISKISGFEGNSIFLPAAGYYSNSDLEHVGEHGDYWSSSIITSNAYYYAYDMYFGMRYRSMYNCMRYFGRSVRPVLQE